MHYSDDFLRALGRWQKGWREDHLPRLEITRELLTAIGSLGAPLPTTNPLPTCYRKRFLVPNNPQNNGDFVPLIVNGQIDEGVASWATDKNFALTFKGLLRPKEIAALFEHRPTPDEVIVDIVALWKDPDFAEAIKLYAASAKDFSDALIHMGANQSELILRAPLMVSELAGLAGQASDEEIFYKFFGAKSDSEKDAVWNLFSNANMFPGYVLWIDKAAVHRVLHNASLKFLQRRIFRLKLAKFRGTLLTTTSLVSFY